ncbi:hypothetical protein Goshw_020948 [Gossypium schwendimanii]|uniref:DUF4283 domain-containing protein n=1 Tax=Gossypium schwendimanii TaxID=34291 RepID=A0A7J9LR27_GOSSC|nr:hypothetical protein [Gossypium schwendimanii]
METKLAGLTLNEEEEAVLQIQQQPNTERELGAFRLIGCFLTTSIIHFPTMKSIMANLWHPIHNVPIGFFFENLAMLLGNFIGKFMEYDGSNLRKENQNFMRIKVQIDILRPLKRKKSMGVNSLVDQVQTAMDHDLEDGVLIGDKEKKRARGRLKN